MSKARELANLGNAYSDGALSNRNLIINGSLIVNQRNADTAITSGWPVDRWGTADNRASMTYQRNGGAYSKAEGFENYLRMIVTSPVTRAAGDYAVIYHPVEAYNIQALKWGTPQAGSATLSFVSRSNVTGTFGGSIQNHDGSMCYPFTYTITSANTWERHVVVIEGATTGTWNHGNGRGVTLSFSAGVGSTYSRPAGTWTTDYTFTATGAVDITDTLNNYLAVTGVQLEVGDTVTPFEHRSYGDELARCQRYYWKKTNINGVGIAQANVSDALFAVDCPVVMRAAPTATALSGGSTDAVVAISGTPSAGGATGLVHSTHATHVFYTMQCSGGTSIARISYNNGTATADAEL